MNRTPIKILTASLAVISLLSLKARSDSAAELATRKILAKQHYLEAIEAPEMQFDGLDAKGQYFLNLPESERIEVELDENGQPLEDLGANTEESIELEETEKEGSESSTSGVTPQAFKYYNSGFLKNASTLAPEGPGYVKIFQDRDEALGGRSWGTRSLISTVQEVAKKHHEKNPNRERLQIADISKKTGGNIKHASHQNGLDVDIVYLQKVENGIRPAEQEVRGQSCIEKNSCACRNGFSKRFVCQEVVGYKKKKNSSGKWVNIADLQRRVNQRFDAAANFELIYEFVRTADVNRIFIDKLLIASLTKYAYSHGYSQDPIWKSMLQKMAHQNYHDDHFHLRLNCQSTDTQCLSEIRTAKHRSKVKKRAAAAKVTAPKKGVKS